MNFTLEDIRRLSEMQENPQHADGNLCDLTRRKLEEVNDHLRALYAFREELTRLKGYQMKPKRSYV